MKDLRLFLPLFLLIVLVLLLTGCKGIVPSPGVTEDETTVSGQILMPYCCLLAEEAEESVLRDKYSGYDCYDETEIWRPTPEAVVELREYDDCKVKYTTSTDETGYYEFTDVKPGLYILTTFCPTDETYYLKDVIEKTSGTPLDAGIPDCDSTSLAMVIEYIGDTYCHCQVVCPCFSEQWSQEYKLIKAIAESDEVNMEVDIPAIIAHEDFGTLCNVDTQGNLIENDLVDMVCSKLQACCVSPGTTNDGGDDDDPGISLTKSANINCYTPGGSITYTLTVTNTGDYNFSQVVVTDDLLGLNENIGSLSTGVSWSDEFAYPVPEEFEGTLTNNAEATGTYGGGSTISDQASVSLEICEVECPPLEEALCIGIADATVCDDECATIGPVTISFTDATPDLVISDLEDASLAWDTVPAGISFDPSDGEVCLTGEPGLYTLGVTYTDACDETAYGTVDVTFEVCCYNLTLYAGAGGSVSDTEDNGCYAPGTTVNIDAYSNPGYQFVGWEVNLGDPSNVDNTGSADTDVEMNEDMTLTASFIADCFQGGTVTVAFEDLEIVEGSDYDYNDWIANIEIDTLFDGDTPNLSSITFNITPKARGAGHDHRFHILIPAGTFSGDGDYNLDIFGDSGDDNGTFNSSLNMDFVVIPDTRDSLGDEDHNHTNTLENEGPTPASVTATLTITFDTPFYHDFSQYDPYSTGSMHGEGLFFDPYIEVDESEWDQKFDNPDYEIHKEDPRMLTVPEDWEWPEEGIAIWDVYSGVTSGNPPTFTPDWWTFAPSDCVYGDGVTCSLP